MRVCRRILLTVLLVAIASCCAAASRRQQQQPPEATPDKTQEPPSDTPAVPDSKLLEPISSSKATYPLEARINKIQGRVVVKMLVSESGDVLSAEAVSGDPVLAGSAVSAVKKWKFKPFIKGGKAVRVSTTVPIDFAFNEKVEDVDAQYGPPGTPAADAGSDNSKGAVPRRVRVSAGVTTGLLIHKVSPVYPPEARRARIQGTVVFQALIGKDGSIKELKLISGHPDLVQAAQGAVQQWRYKPYLLEGVPIDVETTIQVNFTLVH